MVWLFPCNQLTGKISYDNYGQLAKLKARVVRYFLDTFLLLMYITK